MISLDHLGCGVAGLVIMPRSAGGTEYSSHGYILRTPAGTRLVEIPVGLRSSAEHSEGQLRQVVELAVQHGLDMGVPHCYLEDDEFPPFPEETLS